MKIVAGGIPTGSDFYDGRKKSIVELREKLEKKDVLVLGPRRTGKTSVIKEYIAEQERAGSTHNIFIDLEKVQTLYEFYILILREIYQKSKTWKILLNDGTDLIKRFNNYVSDILVDGVEAGSLLTGTENISVKLKIPKFDIGADTDRLDILAKELDKTLSEINTKITIVLDEFPELIWKFGKGEQPDKQKEIRKVQTQLLLEGLRAVRQESSEQKHKIIIAGSVNLQNTLKHLQLDHLINDIETLKIPYLRPPQVKELLDELMLGLKITIDDQAFLDRLINEEFGFCTPFYVQVFAEQLRQLFLDKGIVAFTNDNLRLCYRKTMIGDKGPSYFRERIKKYYEGNETKVEYILQRVAGLQFVGKQGCSEKELSEELIEKFAISRSQVSDIIAQMYSDDLIQLVGDGTILGLECQLISNYWNNVLGDAGYIRI